MVMVGRSSVLRLLMTQRVDFDFLEIVCQKQDSIKNIIEDVENHFDTTVLSVYIWKSRVTGKAKFDSDVDIFLQVPENFNVDNLDMVNNYLRETKQNSLGFLELDVRFGIGIPPTSPYKKLGKLSSVKVSIPQKEVLQGEVICDLKINSFKVDQFMISVPNYNMITGYWHEFYRNREGSKEYSPRTELLFMTQNKSHELLHLNCGTQPFGSYLRGHIGDDQAHNIVIDGKIQKNQILGDCITIQQYYYSVWRPNVNFFDMQVEMNKIGMTKLLESGYLQPDLKIYFENHSHPWEKYLCNPFFPMTALNVFKLMQLPIYELKQKWKVLAEFGTKHIDQELVKQELIL